MSQMEDRIIVKHHEKTAHGLLLALSRISGLLVDGSYVYRGVGDAKLELLPCAFRHGVRFMVDKQPYCGPGETYGEQVRVELGTLLAFLEAVDRQGRSIPEDSQDLRFKLQDMLTWVGIGKKAIDCWPPSEVLSMLGLAQHYGVPTRLLDWSRNPNVAAYFAAYSACHRQTQNGNLCVWAMLEDILMLESMLDDGGFRRSKRPIRLVTVPAADNPNVRAQQGVFVVHQQYDVHEHEEFFPEPYDQLIKSSLHLFRRVDRALFFKFTLPQSEAPQLLRLLARESVDAAMMFPSLDGAARHIQEKWLWPNSKSSNDAQLPQFKDRLKKYLKPDSG